MLIRRKNLLYVIYMKSVVGGANSKKISVRNMSSIFRSKDAFFSMCKQFSYRCRLTGRAITLDRLKYLFLLLVNADRYIRFILALFDPRGTLVGKSLSIRLSQICRKFRFFFKKEM